MFKHLKFNLISSGSLALGLLLAVSSLAQEKKGAQDQAEDLGLMWEYVSPPATQVRSRIEKPKAKALDSEDPQASPVQPSLPAAAEDSQTPVATPKEDKGQPKAKPAAKTKKPVHVKLDFSDIPLIDLVRSYSQITGENFVFADAITGEAKIVTKDKLTLDEARELLEMALGMGGYTILWGNVRGVRFNKIIKKENAISDGDVPVIGEIDPPQE